MAPPNSGKRKRPDRQYSQEDAGRPSPHQPERLNLAQQQQQHRGRGGRGGGRDSRRSSRQEPASPATPRRNPSPPAQRATPVPEPSRPTTPAPPVETPAPPSQQEEAPRGPPAPYVYEHLTDEVVEAWQDTGRQTLLDAAKGEGEFVPSAVVQELVRAGLDGRIEATEAGSVVKDLISQQSEGSDIQPLFLDTISLLDDADMKAPALQRLVTATNIDPDVMRQELDVPLLVALGLTRNTFDRMKIRKATNLLYRQANFNLLREETEGYAKLLTDYYNAASESALSDDAETAKAAFHRTMALVGAFDLDVGRVLDITLDISASLLVKAYRFFVKFYRCSSWWPQNDTLDNVRWEDQGFGSLPVWAEPGYGKWTATEEDKARISRLRQERDTIFWSRVREVGMDAFFELGQRKIVDYEAALPILEAEVPPQHDSKGKEINPTQRQRTMENRKYMKETKMLPPPGNPDAAQLLGFKLRFYASDARDAEDVMPENLIYMAALLIKIGFISLRDLYPHLHPADEGMDAEKERLEKEKAEKERKERPGGGMNALLAAGALADDTVPAVRGLRGEAGKSGGSSPKVDKKEDESKEELPPPPNQKIILLKALLAIGALPDALFILGRFPWLAEVDTSIAPYLHRIVTVMLSKVGDDLKPLQGRTDLQDTKQQLANTSARPDGTLDLKNRSKIRTRRWLGLDEPDDGEGVSHRHYYEDWDDNIPICQDVEDVFLLCSTFLGYLGVKIGQNSLTMTRLLRLAKQSLLEDTSDDNRTRWLDLMKRQLVPALSWSNHDPAVAQEVWELLKMFPITTRYNIYAEWFKGKTSRTPDMKVALDRNKFEARDVLRRITNESGKKQARALAKVSFASPGIVVETFINQLESYSNMIPGLVESVRYFSLLAYDVLTWCLINALSGTGRNRMQGDGMLTSAWLQALSLFVASLFTRYQLLTPAPILQYVAFELRNGDSTDLELIDQILADMAGVKSEMNFNETQVLGMTGGELLQSQIVQQLADQRHLRKTSAKRLMRALTDPGLTGQILISIAQERQMYSHRESARNMPLKVLGNNLDKIQQVFAQYLDVLRTNLSPADFEAAVPDVISLIGDFGLEPSIAFAICRTAILHRMAEVDAAERQRKADEKKRNESEEKASQSADGEIKDPSTSVEATDKQIEKDTAADHEKNAPATNGETTASSDDANMLDAPAGSQVKDEPTPTPLPSTFATVNGDANPWHPVLQPIMERLPEVTGDLPSRMSIPFYVTFWTLAPQDIFVPMEVYQSEIDKLQAQVKQIATDRSDLSAVGMKERDRKKRTVTDLVDRLRVEMNDRIRGYSQVKMWLNTQKKHWFPRLASAPERVARHLALLQDCFLPRAVMSALDAHYCLQIIKTMHNNATPGFSTMMLLDQLFSRQRLAAVISQCTAREAENFGRFLYEFLKLLAHWHSKQEIYEKEALGSQKQYHGFARSTDANGSPTKLVEFEDFRRLLSNWHGNLTGALKKCFESGDYMQIRNSIVILRIVVPVFPALIFQGKELLTMVKEVANNDARNDLKLAALSLRGPLEKRSEKWIKPQDFRLHEVKEGSVSRAPSARPETPQPGAGTPKLNAAAAEFKPNGSKLTNGDTRKESGVGTEDGEIEDEKAAVTQKQDVKMEDAQPQKAEDKTSQVTKSEARTQTPSEPARDARRIEPKPSTPAPSGNPRHPTPVTNGTGRNEDSRANSQQPSRPSSTLPPRPAGDPPNKPLPAPPSAMRGPRGGRDEEQYGRLDRPGDGRHPPSRDRSPGGHRSRQRTPERDPREQYGPPRSYRDDRPPMRGAADPRYPRDDPREAPRREPLGPPPGPPSRGQSDGRDRAMGPPPAQSPHPDRLNQIRSDNVTPNARQDSRATSSQPPTPANANAQPAINPARAAMMAEDTRGGRDRDRRQERDPRPNERDVRPNGRHEPMDPRAEQSAEHAPTGPRASRGGGGRELFDQSGTPSRQEPARGRLGREMGPPQQESSYGRLNGPNPDTPSGPRAPSGPAGRGGRNFTAPGRQEAAGLPPRPSESPAAPRGPQALRDSSSRHEPDSPAERQTPGSQPSTPAAENGPIAGMHPSRMANFSQPPPIQTNVNAPPSGPRSANNRPPVGTPTGPSPTSSAPNGPGGTAERQRRGDRQRANINATLSANGTQPQGPPAGAQGTQFRGAARNASFSGQSPVAPGPQGAPPPAMASPMDAPSRPGNGPGRSDSRGDLFDDRNGGRSRRYEDERGHNSHRSSRNASRERRPDDEPPRRPPPPGMDDGRDKRATPRGDERRPRDDRSSRDPAPRDSRRGGREEQALPPRPGRMPDAPAQYGPGAPPPPPPPEWERDSRRRVGAPDDGSRRRGEDYRGGGPPRREDRPPRDDGSDRKRRHEDSAAFDPSKRRRSGRP